MTASPTPTPAPVATPRLEDGEGSALPCGLLLALVGGGIGLILLGVWGFWVGRKVLPLESEVGIEEAEAEAKAEAEEKEERKQVN